MPKKIVLCADGTGNTRNALFRTNVWKLYDALDVTPESHQIAYYHDGVGTSSFAPLKFLGGIFGYGVAANVRDMYSFLCRNYELGDHIYIFGFSRGAFTARILASFISHTGVQPLKDDGEIEAWTRRAFLHYRRVSHWARYGWVRKAIAFGWHKLRGGFRDDQVEPVPEPQHQVAFVGVWDTVSAYGGPIVEMVRAWDRWVFPLSFADYVLPRHVQCARHALALDEEREAFTPLLWDELKSGDRVKQVWFAGVHSDVGGGYPDQGLSNVPLVWMMEHTADAPGGALSFAKAALDRINLDANPLGPRHDSRSGIAIAYRYQPRWLGAYTQPARGAPSRDPATGPDPMLKSAVIHSSVIERQRHGLDGYAPIALPTVFNDIDDRTHALDPALQRPILQLATRRRRLQFMLLVVGALMAISAAWPSPWSGPLYAGLRGTGRLLAPFFWFGYAIDFCNQTLGGVVKGTLGLIPGVPSWAAQSYSESGGYLLGFALLLLLFVRLSGRTGQQIEAAARRMWSTAYNPPPKPEPFRISRWNRVSWPIRRFLRWRLTPDLLGISYWLILFWIMLALANQVSLSLYARGNHWCGDTAASRVFHTHERCHALHRQVFKGQVFQLQLAIPAKDSAQWYDASMPASPAGFTYSESLGQQVTASSPAGMLRVTVAHLFGAALKQDIGARWFTPIIAIRPSQEMIAKGGKDWVRTVAVKMEAGAGGIYHGTFVAPTTGFAYLYVNDATLPFAPSKNTFYDNNCGWAHVRLSPAYGREHGRLRLPVVPDPSDAVCAKARQQERAAK